MRGKSVGVGMGTGGRAVVAHHSPRHPRHPRGHLEGRLLLRTGDSHLCTDGPGARPRGQCSAYREGVYFPHGRGAFRPSLEGPPEFAGEFASCGDFGVLRVGRDRRH